MGACHAALLYHPSPPPASQPAAACPHAQPAAAPAAPSLTSLLVEVLEVTMQVQRLLLLRRRCGVGKVGGVGGWE